MLKRLLFSFLVFCTFAGDAQINLVPNPSFEINDTCPDNTGQIFHATSWFNPTQGSPDYLNSCSSFLGTANLWGYQNAHLGNAYAGLFASVNDTSSGIYDYREYVEVKLDSALASGVKYFVSFYVSLADSMNFATDRIGANFSTDTIQNDSLYGFMLYQTPQIENSSGNFLTDKFMWTKISGSFVATGGERFLTVGSFHNDFNTNTTPVSGGAIPPMADWSGGYYYLDDICVSTDSIYTETWTGIFNKSTTNINIFPNPASSHIMVANIPPHSIYSIIDVMGKVVEGGEFIELNSIIDVTTFNNGVYFLLLNNKDSFKIIINH